MMDLGLSLMIAGVVGLAGMGIWLIIDRARLHEELRKAEKELALRRYAMNYQKVGA